MNWLLSKVVGPHIDGDGWKGWLIVFAIVLWLVAIALLFGLGLAFLWLAKVIGVLG